MCTSRPKMKATLIENGIDIIIAVGEDDLEYILQ
jgi:hypothetical protein